MPDDQWQRLLDLERDVRVLARAVDIQVERAEQREQSRREARERIERELKELRERVEKLREGGGKSELPQWAAGGGILAYLAWRFLGGGNP